MTRSTTEKPDQRPWCSSCGERFGPEEAARHTEPVHCGPCITCVDKPECFSCRLMYCVCDVHRYRG
jgi:hypothetical protein